MYCSSVLQVKTKWMNFNLALRSDTQLQTVHLCLKELLNTIGTRVVTCLPVLLISTKLLTVLTTGYYFVNC